MNEKIIVKIDAILRIESLFIFIANFLYQHKYSFYPFRFPDKNMFDAFFIHHI